MTPFATVMYKPERAFTVALGALALLGASPSLARDQDEPMAGRTPDARDVAMTPLTDLNLSKDPIPPVLPVRGRSALRQRRHAQLRRTGRVDRRAR